MRVAAGAPAAIGSGCHRLRSVELFTGSGRLAAWEIFRFDLLSLSSGRLGSGLACSGGWRPGLSRVGRVGAGGIGGARDPRE